MVSVFDIYEKMPQHGSSNRDGGASGGRGRGDDDLEGVARFVPENGDGQVFDAGDEPVEYDSDADDVPQLELDLKSQISNLKSLEPGPRATHRQPYLRIRHGQRCASTHPALRRHRLRPAGRSIDIIRRP